MTQTTRRIPQAGDRFRHYKGNEYTVLAVSDPDLPKPDCYPTYRSAKHTETNDLISVWLLPGIGAFACGRAEDAEHAWYSYPEKLVFYFSPENSAPDKIWARPLDNFLATLPEGGHEGSTRWYRFELIVEGE